MADYQKMYCLLVDEVSSTIDRLKLALNKAEDVYIDSDEEQENDEESK